MVYIFFSTGSLHLINIFELIKKNKIKDYKIFIIKSINTRANSEMFNTARFLNLKNIKSLSWSSFLVKRIFQYLSYVNKTKLQFLNKKITFVISDFNNFFFHFLRIFFKNSNFILIDEGIGSIASYKKYLSRGIYFPINQYKNFTLGLCKFLLPRSFKTLLYSKIKFYTFCGDNFNDKDIIINNLTNIKKKLSRNYKKDNSIVFFVGTKLSEIGALSLNEELNILHKIKLYWNKRGKKLIYVAKRSSSNQKIILIKKKLLIECIRFSLPLEIALGKEYKKIPFAISSHGGALSITLEKIYNIKASIFIPKKHKKNTWFLDNIDNLVIGSKKKIINI